MHSKSVKITLLALCTAVIVAMHSSWLPDWQSMRRGWWRFVPGLTVSLNWHFWSGFHCQALQWETCDWVCSDRSGSSKVLTTEKSLKMNSSTSENFHMNSVVFGRTKQFRFKVIVENSFNMQMIINEGTIFTKVNRATRWMIPKLTMPPVFKLHFWSKCSLWTWDFEPVMMNCSWSHVTEIHPNGRWSHFQGQHIKWFHPGWAFPVIFMPQWKKKQSGGISVWENNVTVEENQTTFWIQCFVPCWCRRFQVGQHKNDPQLQCMHPQRLMWTISHQSSSASTFSTMPRKFHWTVCATMLILNDWWSPHKSLQKSATWREHQRNKNESSERIKQASSLHLRNGDTPKGRLLFLVIPNHFCKYTAAKVDISYLWCKLLNTTVPTAIIGGRVCVICFYHSNRMMHASDLDHRIWR